MKPKTFYFRADPFRDAKMNINSHASLLAKLYLSIGDVSSNFVKAR